MVSFGNKVAGNLVHKPYTCVGQMPSITASFLGKNIIFYALQSKYNCLIHTYRLLGMKRTAAWNTNYQQNWLTCNKEQME
jgi:hypothetical protein